MVARKTHATIKPKQGPDTKALVVPCQQHAFVHQHIITAHDAMESNNLAGSRRTTTASMAYMGARIGLTPCTAHGNELGFPM